MLEALRHRLRRQLQSTSLVRASWPNTAGGPSAWPARDRLVGGEKLHDAGVLVEGPGDEGVDLLGGEHRAPLGRLSGYFVISAGDRAEVLAIAGTCPHLRHGGRIVVRPIDPT